MLQDISHRMQPGTYAWDAMGSEKPQPSHPMLPRIAELCMRTGADFCAIFLDGAHLPAAFATTDSDRWGAIAAIPHSDSYGVMVLAAGIDSLIDEPLVSERRLLGSLALGFSSPPVDANRETIEVVSQIISIALEQAAELAHHYHVSKRLQKALLPARLARVEGLEFDAAYRPASDEAEVGGDWYDAFEIGNGTIGISVGDVTGHGLEAAVAMSEIARAIRSAAASTESPSALLNYVDAFVCSHHVAMATAIVGIYNPKTRILRYASAGHPHPVLVMPTNRAYVLQGGGLLLGVGMGASSPDWTVTLSPGSSCFLYTDGLLEYSRDLVVGERTLLNTLEQLAKGGERSAGALHDAIFAEVQNGDDVATLALHNSDASASPTLHLVYSAVTASATIVREVLRDQLDRLRIDPACHFDVLAAAGEAVGNAIEHGMQDPGVTFSVDIRLTDLSLVIQVENQGHWRAFTPKPERGRGMTIMRACAGSVELASTRDSTCVTITFGISLVD